MTDSADRAEPTGAAPPQVPGDAPADTPDLTRESAPAPDDASQHAEGDQSAHQEGPDEASAVVRYGLMRNIAQLPHSLDPAPPRGAKVVIRTERGVELGEIVCGVGEPACRAEVIPPGQVKSFVKACGKEYPFLRKGRILRLASPQDVSDQEHLDRGSREQLNYCKQQVAELKLNMHLVTVENLLGGERVIFYFTAEHRVDFRELVRRLASEYRTRIEMRQVGARDEARLVGDYERCGQRCCCQQYLKDLSPVSIRMAKTQKATLDPAKISGRCGRLMCCLRYEDEGYEDLKKRLPRRNRIVRTEELIGKVLDVQILTQLVRVVTPQGLVTVIENDAILERDLPQEAFDNERARPSSRPSRSDRPRPGREQPPQQPAKAEPDAGDEQPKKKRRRRRRKKKPAQAEQGGQKQPGAAQSRSGEGAGGEQPKKKRRRRRRKKNSSGDSFSGGDSDGGGE